MRGAGSAQHPPPPLPKMTCGFRRESHFVVVHSTVRKILDLPLCVIIVYWRYPAEYPVVFSMDVSLVPRTSPLLFGQAHKPKESSWERGYLDVSECQSLGAILVRQEQLFSISCSVASYTSRTTARSRGLFSLLQYRPFRVCARNWGDFQILTNR